LFSCYSRAIDLSTLSFSANYENYSPKNEDIWKMVKGQNSFTNTSRMQIKPFYQRRLMSVKLRLTTFYFL